MASDSKLPSLTDVVSSISTIVTMIESIKGTVRTCQVNIENYSSDITVSVSAGGLGPYTAQGNNSYNLPDDIPPASEGGWLWEHVPNSGNGPKGCVLVQCTNSNNTVIRLLIIFSVPFVGTANYYYVSSYGPVKGGVWGDFDTAEDAYKSVKESDWWDARKVGDQTVTTALGVPVTAAMTTNNAATLTIMIDGPNN